MRGGGDAGEIRDSGLDGNSKRERLVNFHFHALNGPALFSRGLEGEETPSTSNAVPILQSLLFIRAMKCCFRLWRRWQASFVTSSLSSPTTIQAVRTGTTDYNNIERMSGPRSVTLHLQEMIVREIPICCDHHVWHEGGRQVGDR